MHAPHRAGALNVYLRSLTVPGVQLVALNLSGSLKDGPPACLALMAHLRALYLSETCQLGALPAGPYRQSLAQLDLSSCGVEQPG